MARFITHILLIVGVSGLNAAYGQQCYQQIRDYSGFNTAPYQSELNTAACSLIQALPTEFQNNFKVFSCGFYVEHQFFNNFSYPEAFESVRAEAAAQSQYYLLLGRQSDPSGLYTRYWVDLKLPTTGIFHCLDEISPEFRQALTNKYGLIANQAHESFNRSVVDYAKAEKITMDSLKNFILQSFECCPPERSRSTGEYCVTCPYNNDDLKDVLFEELPDINVSPCTYSTLFTPQFTSEYLVGGSNSEVTRLGEVINLDLAAYEVAIQQHNLGHSSKSYVVHAGMNCLSFISKIAAFIQDNSYAKFLFVLLPTGTGDNAELYCCSIIGGVVGNCPELNANGSPLDTEAKILICDKANFFYSGNFNASHEYIPGIISNDCINSKINVLEKNGNESSSIEPAEAVEVNPDSKAFSYLFNAPCLVVAPSQFTKVEWKLNGVIVNIADQAFNLYTACADIEKNILTLDITYKVSYSTGDQFFTRSTKITLKKAKPEPILIALHPVANEPNHTHAYYDINLPLNEDELTKLESALSLKYKFGPAPGVPSTPKRLSSDMHIDKNDYGSPFPGSLFIGIRALFRSHKGDFFINDNPAAFNIIEWNLKTSKFTGKDIPVNSSPPEFNNLSQGEVFKYTADIYAVSDVAKANRLSSLGVNISNGAPTDLYYFEIYVNGVPKMGPDGTTPRKFKAGSSPGDVERCELNYEKGQIIKIKIFKTGSPNAQKADWYIGNVRKFENKDEFGPYTIPDNNNFTVSAYKKNSTTELWGNLYFQVKPKPAEEKPFDPTGIASLKYELPVDEETKKNYDQLYGEAMASIKVSKPNMMAPYTRESNPFPVQVHLTDNNYGGFAANPNLQGYTNANTFRYASMFAKLDHRDVLATPEAIAGGNVITNAFVLVIEVDDRVATCFTAPTPDITIKNEVADDYIKRLAMSGDATDLAKSQELLNLYNAGGNAPPLAINGYKQKVLQNEWGLFMGFAGVVNIYIKKGDILINDDYSTVKNKYLDTQPHEFAHGIYPYLYKYDNLRWLSLRDAVDAGKHPGKIYADKYQKNGPAGDHSHCSEGPGHEWYNPENTYSCGGGN